MGRFGITWAFVLVATTATLAGAQRVIPADTIGCRDAARAAVKLWLIAIATGDTLLVRRAVSPSFGVMSLGRNGWPEPFVRMHSMRDIVAYFRRRAGKHEHFAKISVPTGPWMNGRLGVGVVSYARRADDVKGVESWLGKGEYDCGRGIHVLNTSPQGDPPRR